MSGIVNGIYTGANQGIFYGGNTGIGNGVGLGLQVESIVPNVIIRNGLVLHLDAANALSYPRTGTLWRDISRNNNNGTLINSPTFSLNNGGSIRCNGVNNFIEVLDKSSLDFGSSNFTVEYWFRKLTGTTGGFGNLFGPNKWNTGAVPGSNEWALIIGNGTTGSGNNYSFTVEVGNTFYSTGESSEVLALNTWYQLIGMREGLSLKTYLNCVIKQIFSLVGFSAS